MIGLKVTVKKHHMRKTIIIRYNSNNEKRSEVYSPEMPRMLHITGAAKCLASYVEVIQGLDVIGSLKSEVVHVAVLCFHLVALHL